MDIIQPDQITSNNPSFQDNKIQPSFQWRDENFFDFQNINNKNILNNIYGKEIFSIVDKISSLKNNSSSYLERMKEELNTGYETFNNEILKYINITTNKIIHAFQLDLSNINEEKSSLILEFSSEKINILKKIISLHKQIFEVIQQNFLILKNFLQISELLDKEQPIQEFFTKEFDNILKSWLFLKLDLEKFNFKNIIDSSNLNQNYKDFILKECQGKNSVMNIELSESELDEISQYKNKEKFKQEIKMISENMNHLVILNMINVPNVDDYLGKANYVTVKKFKLINSTYKGNIFKQFPSLVKLKIKFFPLFDMSLLSQINQVHLKKLILNKNGFVNQDFDNLISNYILKSPNLLNSLELLSLAKNNITKIDFSRHLTLPKHTFRALKALLLNKNKIYKFLINKDFFPELKHIDCCNNNLAKNFFIELENNDNIIVLQSANFFLLENDLCQEYYKNLESKLNKNIKNLSLVKLNLSYLPTNFGQSFFKELNINYSFLIRLRKLNLSYNGLTCNTLFSFLQKNKECLNLRSLNLIGNSLDDTFFEIFLNLRLNKIFSNLQSLYLNDNKIGGNSIINYEDDYPISNIEKKEDIFKLRLMYKFISENKNLKVLTITKNPIREKYIIKYEPSQNSEISDEYIKKDSDGNIIINCFYSFLIKIKNELLDREGYKKDIKGFNIGFDCAYDVNLNSENYPYSSQPIIFK